MLKNPRVTPGKHLEAFIAQKNEGAGFHPNSESIRVIEAPQGYKNIESVIKDMEDEGLVKVIATFRPLITYKVKTRKAT